MGALTRPACCRQVSDGTCAPAVKVAVEDATVGFPTMLFPWALSVLPLDKPPKTGRLLLVVFDTDLAHVAPFCVFLESEEQGE